MLYVPNQVQRPGRAKTTAMGAGRGRASRTPVTDSGGADCMTVAGGWTESLALRYPPERSRLTGRRGSTNEDPA